MFARDHQCRRLELPDQKCSAGNPLPASRHGRRGRYHVRGANVAQLDLKTFFKNVSDDAIADANDILRPYEKLVPIKCLGEEIHLPENNSLWRGLQFWGLMTGEVRIDFGLFCIAGTCLRCKSLVKTPGAANREPMLLCQTTAEPGLEIMKLAQGFSYKGRQR